MRPLLSMILLLSCALPVAHAQVRRCTAPDGTEVFTDRRCEDLGAVERKATPAAIGGNARVSANSCPHSLHDLAFELTTALDAHDVNRLASVYHWVGMPTATAYAVMGRLDTLVQRPLVDIVPLYTGSEGEDGLAGDYYPQATVRRTPVGLRLEQTLANSTTPSRTVLGLRRYLGCWWVSL